MNNVFVYCEIEGTTVADVTGEKYRLGVSGGGLYYRKEEKA